MNYIITKNKEYFRDIGTYNFCNLEDMILEDIISIDTETTGLEARKCDLTSVQIGTGKNNYLIKLYEEDYTFLDVLPYIKDKTLVLHNALFDLGFMYKYSFYPEKIKDTMLASKILYNGDITIRHDFGKVMERELGVIYDKTEQKNIAIVKLSQASSIKYCFNDVDRLIELHTVLEQKIDEGGFRPAYDLHCRYIRALAYMEQCGLGISSSKWKAKMEEDVKNTNKYSLELISFIAKNSPEFKKKQLSLFEEAQKIDISLSSPLQMFKVFESFKIPILDKDGKKSINENIIKKSDHEFVKMWLNFQESNHRVSTFGKSIYDKIENERIYTSFNPMVDTARLSTRRGNINFLNFPSDKATRSCFEVQDDKSLIVCDWSGQENVIIADLSGDAAMTSSVINGDDLHCMFAKVLFPEISNLSDEEITINHKSKRQAAKSPRFAFAYGGNAYTIHVNEGIPLRRAEEIEKGFKELHSGLYEWGEKVFKKAILVGYIESVDGWKLKLPKFEQFKDLKEKVEAITKEEWTIYKEGKLENNRYKKAKEDKKDYIIKNESAFQFYQIKKSEVSNFFKLKSEYQRLCLNNPVQTRGAFQLKLSISLLFEWILKNNYQNKVLICNTVHDETIAECPKEIEQEVINKVQECMIEGGNYYLTNLKIKAEAHAGKSWSEAK